MSTVMAVTNSNRPDVAAWVTQNGAGLYTVKLKVGDTNHYMHGLGHLEAIFKAQQHCADN